MRAGPSPGPGSACLILATGLWSLRQGIRVRRAGEPRWPPSSSGVIAGIHKPCYRRPADRLEASPKSRKGRSPRGGQRTCRGELKVQPRGPVAVRLNRSCRESSVRHTTDRHFPADPHDPIASATMATSRRAPPMFHRHQLAQFVLFMATSRAYCHRRCGPSGRCGQGYACRRKLASEASWLNLIEPPFGVLKRYVLADTGGTEHGQRRRRIYRYLRYRNRAVRSDGHSLTKIRSVSIHEQTYSTSISSAFSIGKRKMHFLVFSIS